MSAFGAVLSGIGSVLSPVMSYFGQKSANEQNIALARENREWQEEMSNSEVQRRAKDLESAGFNRLLAVGQSASTPAGNVARVENELESFKNNPLNILALERTRADIDKTKAETAVQSVLAQNQLKEGLLKDLALSYGLVNKKYREAELDLLKGKTPWEILISQGRAGEARYLGALADMRGQIMERQLQNYDLENQILRLSMPGFENAFDVENSMYGQGLEYVRQTLGAVGNLLGPAARVITKGKK